MEGLKLWVMSLIEYDKFGNAKVLRSFAKPARDSEIKYGTKKAKNTKKVKESVVQEGEELF